MDKTQENKEANVAVRAEASLQEQINEELKVEDPGLGVALAVLKPTEVTKACCGGRCK